MRSIIAFAISTTLLLSACFSQTKSATQDQPVFRAPVKLKLHVDNDRFYEGTFDHVPYVADNDVSLFAGEAFGVNVTITEGEISRIAYERDPAKADVELRFTQGWWPTVAGVATVGMFPQLAMLSSMSRGLVRLQQTRHTRFVTFTC